MRAGLWEQDIRLSEFGEIDFNEVYRLAEEQSVIGLLAAGIEHVNDVKVPQDQTLRFVGQALQLEQRNLHMNAYVARLFPFMKDKGVENCLLVKGQGIAQCYERPLWRACGDIDLLLDRADYDIAKEVLIPKAQSVEKENLERKHLGMVLDQWVVELHGTLRSGIWGRMNKVVDEVQVEMFMDRSFRLWSNGETKIKLPSANNDVIFIFSHIIQHYFGEGIGLRQICDWCRFMWKYRLTIDRDLLESRILSMGMMTEWKAFAAFAVRWLGMPVEAMPLYSDNGKWRYKAEMICARIMETGNFGHNIDVTYRNNHPYIVRKFISLSRGTIDAIRHYQVFPVDSLKMWYKKLANGLSKTAKGD